MANHTNGASGSHPVENRDESFWVRVPKKRVEFEIHLPPGRYYYSRAPLGLDEFLEIALATPGAVIRVSEKAARRPRPSRQSSGAGEKPIMGRRLQVVEHVPDNAAILIYAPADDRP